MLLRPPIHACLLPAHLIDSWEAFGCLGQKSGLSIEDNAPLTSSFKFATEKQDLIVIPGPLMCDPFALLWKL